MAEFRQESDAMGVINVPADRYWGAQTERAIKHFAIGKELIPIETVHALTQIKQAAALANSEVGKLSKETQQLISNACDKILSGDLDDEFPLHVWMTGSGTQSNMNVNEVIANLACEATGNPLGSKIPVHPNDHVNMSQSSNDVFPTAMYMSTAYGINSLLLPAVKKLRQSITSKAKDWIDIVKIGRTHLQDAVPLTLGQEFGGFASLLEDNEARLQLALKELMPLPLGGTAVGTGLNAGEKFSELACENLATKTSLPFVSADNKFAVMGSHDALVNASSAIKTLAVTLNKMANDIRLLSCGPRAGLGELHLPENEPGSSIMPGKVNPTQCEALSMVTTQVIASDVAVGLAGAGGILQMNVYKPLMIYNLMQSIHNLTDSIHCFDQYCVAGIEPNIDVINHYVEQSLMLVTALAPVIGYDKASEIAHKAHHDNSSLKDAALALGYVSDSEFDRIINPYQMAYPDSSQQS